MWAAGLALLAASLACAGLIGGGRWLSRRRARRMAGPGGLFDRARERPSRAPESLCLVQLSDQGVSCRRPDGRVEAVAWRDLRRIEIVTTSEGPFHPDVFWVLHGSVTGCVIPQGASGEQQLMERLQQLPEFRNEAVIGAMSSTRNGRFLCWEKRPAGPA